MASFLTKGFVGQMFGGTPDMDSDTFKYILVDTLLTDRNLSAYGYAELTAGYELATGGGYTTGGVTLTSVTIGTGNSNEVYWDADNPQWTSATLSNIYGGIIYDDTVTSPKADPMVLQHEFLGTPLSVTSGTLTVTFADPSSGGIFRGTI